MQTTVETIVVGAIVPVVTTRLHIPKEATTGLLKIAIVAVRLLAAAVAAVVSVGLLLLKY